MPSPRLGLPGEVGCLAVWPHVCVARLLRPTRGRRANIQTIRFWRQGHQEVAAGRLALSRLRRLCRLPDDGPGQYRRTRDQQPGGQCIRRYRFPDPCHPLAHPACPPPS